MDNHIGASDGKSRPVSLLDSLAATTPTAATAEMPADLAAMPNPEKGIFIRCDQKPDLDLAWSQWPARAACGASSIGPGTSRC